MNTAYCKDQEKLFGLPNTITNVFKSNIHTTETYQKQIHQDYDEKGQIEKLKAFATVKVTFM